ncbi:oligosaccharide repeat unit polymerase [Desulfotomaculum arcticum]|uniref:Oligosaccharide repeat unit polymerase n=1 Tax=Desulfotruncus arcticus DSM 17038 TaxID=1121424 RepID=A0A1I2X4N0_9FIRM|nr:O-antigen polysaccharide polymerase Wzy [Desulfotruncus arcticus]SFH07656.1 oligosaccharide repeat unit polymerase [Desulfotomaculum arcticum] [Desulfotruncus arcticus DSM 17038]
MLKTKTKIKKLICIFVTLMMLFFIYILKSTYVVNISYNNSLFWLNFFGLFGWVTLIWSIMSWRILRGEIICIYSIFLGVFYLFTFGQSLLIIFDLVSENRDLLNGISSFQLVEAQIFTLLCLVAFHLGALIICKEVGKETKIYSNNKMLNSDVIGMNKDNVLMIKAIKYAGITLLLFSFPGFIYDTISTLTIVVNEGYRALYGYDGDVRSVGLIARIFQYTSSYFLPALICLLVVYRTKVAVRIWIVAVMIIYIINELYIGGRGGAVSLILVIICLYHYSVKPINKKRVFTIGIFSYCLLSFLSVIAQLRGLSNRSIIDYFVAFAESFGKKNLFFDTLTEIGWTMFPLTMIMQIFPSNYEFFWGKSYFYALTSVIPNLGLWELHPAALYASGSTWLMDLLDLYSGPGFSLCADAFRNFGWYGFIVLLGFGLLFGRIYSSIDKFTIHTRPEILCFVMIFANATMMCVRGDNLYIVRPLFYVVIPIYVLIRGIYYYLLNSRVTHKMSG